MSSTLKPVALVMPVIILVWLIVLACTVCAASQPVGEILIDDFSRYAVGSVVPNGWAVTRGAVCETAKYNISSIDGKNNLRCFSRGMSTFIGKDISTDPLIYQNLSWSWRASQLPAGGKEDTPLKDDCAARVQVVFADDTVLSYNWSSNLPTGSEGVNVYWPWNRYIVIESGDGRANSWIEEQRNILRDYKKLFGCMPPSVKRIDILCDADNTATQAEAYIGRIAFSSVAGIERKLAVLDMSPSGLIVREDGVECQVMELTILNNLSAATMSLDVKSPDGKAINVSRRIEDVETGVVRKEIAIPIPNAPTPVKISLSAPGAGEDATWSGDDVLNPAERWEVYVAPSSHNDYAYGCGTMEALDLNCDVLSKELSILDAEPSMKIDIESAQMVKAYCDRHPENVDKIKTYLKQGRMEVGALWTLPLTGCWDGESYVREISLAKDFLKKQFDYDPVTVQNNDVPGYPRQLGQIMSKSGISGFIWSRGGGVPSPLYQEVSLDGSKQLSYLVSHPWLYGFGYDLGFTNGVDRIREKLPRYLALFGNWSVKKLLVPVETDWSYPDPALPRIVSDWNKKYAYPKLIIATPSEYFAAFDPVKITARNEDYLMEGWAAGAPAFASVVNLQNQVLSSLLAAEKYATLDTLENGATYPQGRLNDAWRNLALTYDHNYGNQHDAASVKERLGVLNLALSAAKGVTDSALKNLAVSINKSKDGTPITVFNPLFTARKEAVTVQLPRVAIKDFLKLEDRKGKIVPYVVQSNGEGSIQIKFIAEVPAFGYSTYYLRNSNTRQPVNSDKELKAEGYSIENRYYRVTVDPTSGVITSIYDKELKRECIDSNAPSGGNELIVDRSFKYGAMVIDEDDRRAKSSGIDMATEQRHPNQEYLFWRQKGSTCKVKLNADNVQARIEVNGKVLGSEFSQRIILYPGLKRVYVTDQIDWQGRNHAKVKVAFPFLINQPKLTVGEPYGVRTVGSSPTSCVQKWLEIGDGKWGVSMATSAGLHGFVDSTIYPILFWDEDSWSDAEGVYWFSPKPHKYEYSFIIDSHRGDWKKGSGPDMGWELAMPLKAVISPSKNGSLPDEMSFGSINDKSIIATVFKVADDGKGVVARCYDASGSTSKARLKLDNSILAKLSGAWAARTTEEKLGQLDISNNYVTIPVKAHGIETVRMDTKLPISVDADEAPNPAIDFSPYTEADLNADAFLSPANYIRNAGFESGSRYIDQLGPYPDDWDGVHGSVHHWGSGTPETVVVDDPATAHSGSRYVKVSLKDASYGSGTQFCQDVPVTPEMRGKVVRLSSYIKTTRPNTTLFLEAFKDGKRVAGDMVRITPYGRWVYCYLDLMIPPEADTLPVGLRVFDNGDGEACFDDVSLKVFENFDAWQQSVRAKVNGVGAIVQ